jgi:hypothetical protein
MRATYDVGLGWVLTDDARQASLSVDMRLPGLTLTVDASLATPVPVEVVVDEGGEPETVAAAARATTERLFGRTPDELLAADAFPPLIPIDAVRMAVEGRQLLRHGHSPGLAAVLSAAAYAELGEPAQAGRFADRSIGAVLALARYAAARPAFLARVPLELRDLLAEQLAQVQDLPAINGSAHRTEGFLDLRTRLALPDLDTDLVALLSDAQLYMQVLASGPHTRSAGPVVVQQRWTVDDLRPCLGDLAEQFFEGVPVQGTVPGLLRGSFWLRRGAADRVGDVVARVYTWEGALLGMAEITVDSAGSLPRGSFELQVGPGRTDTLSAVGVYLEVTPADRPLAAAPVIVSFARRRGARLLGEALELGRAGDDEASRDAFVIADRMRRVVTGDRLEPPGRHVATLPGDGVRAVVEAWRRDAAVVVESGRGSADDERLDALALVMREQGEALSATDELATAYEEYARVLSRVEGPESADAFRGDAIRLRYELHDAGGALDVVADLGTVHDSR